MTNNQKKSLVAFYLSKYNDKAIEKLGYKKITEALNDLSERLKGDGKANSFIKRRRDEFDVFFDNGRVGYRNRKPTNDVEDMYHRWNELSFEELSDIVAQVLDGSFYKKDSIKLDENITENEIEEYLNFEDDSASLNRKCKEVLERKVNKNKINMLKRIYAYRCQICGVNVGSDYGTNIAEAHHINYFSKSIDNSSDNIVILCPNHHSLIHKLNPQFDYEKLQYVYPNGKVDKLILDLHLAKDRKDN